MSKLDELIKKFTEDKNWNTEEKDGYHRFDEKIVWIEKMIREYAGFFNLTTDEIVDTMENNRNYSWPNYYQEANFTRVSKFGELAGVYKTFDEFHQYAKENLEGFKCPKCGNIGYHPQECEHRIAKNGKCDWCSYGLFSTSDKVVILENGFKTIPILQPILKS